MKRHLFILGAICLVAGLVLVARARVDTAGREITASTTTQQITGITADWISVKIDNDQTDTVYCKTDCTTNAFNTALAAGECVALKGGETFLWPASPHTVITNFVYATTNGTASARVSWAQAINRE